MISGMRLAAASTFAALLAALLCARYAEPGPVWLASLYALPLAGTLFGVAVVCALLELRMGESFRAVAPFLALASSVFALSYALFERAPGTLPHGLPLDRLSEKALSICALGMTLSAAGLGAVGLRAPRLASRLCASFALAGALLAARGSLAALGLPYLSSWSVGLLAISMAFALVSNKRGWR